MSGIKRSLTTVVFAAFQRSVVLDGNYEVVSAEISGGEYVTEEEYNAFQQAR